MSDYSAQDVRILRETLAGICNKLGQTNPQVSSLAVSALGMFAMRVRPYCKHTEAARNIANQLVCSFCGATLADKKDDSEFARVGGEILKVQGASAPAITASPFKTGAKYQFVRDFVPYVAGDVATCTTVTDSTVVLDSGRALVPTTQARLVLNEYCDGESDEKH